MKKIIVLHGAFTNSNIIKIQSAYLREIINKFGNFTYIFPEGDYDFEVQKIPIYAKLKFDPPYKCWYNNEIEYKNSKKKLIEKYKDNNIIGVIGFSQGAVMGYKILDDLKPKFYIGLSGLTSMDLNPNISIVPSIYVLGKNDSGFKKAMKFISLGNKEKKILYHKGSHDFPFNNSTYLEIERELAPIISEGIV